MKVSILSTYPKFINVIKSVTCFILVSMLTFCFMNAQVTEDTIQVGVGWNMVGSLYTGTPSEILRSEPSDIFASAFFSYNPGGGYEAKDTLEKGNGYWVKVNEDGKIIFRGPVPACPGTPTVEYGGKTYNTVQIGSQCWLKENLDVGAMISGAFGSNQTNNGVIEKFCYDNNSANCDIYGGLYQWDEAMQYTTVVGAKGICPDGWHVATFSEFNALSTAVGGDGNALKAIGQGSDLGAGTNTSGFSALIGGLRWFEDGSFMMLGTHGCFWTSTENNSVTGLYMQLFSYKDGIGLGAGLGYYSRKSDGMSVRCIMD